MRGGPGAVDRTPLPQEPATDVDSGVETNADLRTPGRTGISLRLGGRVLGVSVAVVCAVAAATMLYPNAASPRPARRRAGGGLGAVRGAELRELSRELEAKFGLAADVGGWSPESVASEDEAPADTRGNTLDFLFLKADADGSGFVEAGELATIEPGLRAMFGARPELDELLKESAADDDSRLDPEAFKSLLLALEAEPHDERSLAKFRSADLDHSGFLEGKKELLPLFKYTVKKLPIDKATSQRLLADADLDADGKMSFEEYKSLLRTVGERYGQKVPLMKTILFFFQVADADESGFIEGEEKETVEKALKKKFGLSDDAYRKLAASDSDDKMDLKDLTQVCLSLAR
jgi:Ca2+-binding EF-hand superfamily protein